jgi:hypothetical protein
MLTTTPDIYFNPTGSSVGISPTFTVSSPVVSTVIRNANLYVSLLAELSQLSLCSSVGPDLSVEIQTQ